MSRILKDAEIAFLRTCREACDAALVSAAPKMEADFKTKVVNQAVTDYYTDYKPSRYKRTYQLYKAFPAYSIISGDGISIGAEMDFNYMAGHKSKSSYHQLPYYENGESVWISRYDKRFNMDEDDEGNPIGDNGLPEAGWIFQNYMEGIHPRFITKNGIVYDKSRQFEPSWKRIKKYLNEYQNDNDLKNILATELKKQYKKFK